MMSVPLPIIQSMSQNLLKPQVSLLVTDLDNTLWDWFEAWHASFSVLLDGVAEVTGVDVEQLEKEIREVHQFRGTSEYSWLLYELPSVSAYCGDEDPFVVFRSVIRKQNSARFHGTRLYDGVLDTLAEIQKAGVKIVAYTESQAYWTKWRLQKLGLDGVLHRLYSSADHDAPAGLVPASKRYNPAQDFALKETAHHHVHSGVIKPDPLILKDILNEYDVPVERVVYIGDSLQKDVAMGQAVGVIDAYAKYGSVQMNPAYEQLRRVSHWTDEMIERERLARPDSTPEPTYTMTKGFHELLEKFVFVP